MDRKDQQILTLQKQKKYAWAQYYTKIQEEIENYTNVINQAENLRNNNEIPNHFLRDYFDMADKLRKQIECPICRKSL